MYIIYRYILYIYIERERDSYARMLICCYMCTPMQDAYSKLKTTTEKAQFRASWAQAQHAAYRESKVHVESETRTDFTKGHSEIHTSDMCISFMCAYTYTYTYAYTFTYTYTTAHARCHGHASGQHLPLARTQHKEGGGPDGLMAACSYALRCLELGPPWALM